MRINVACILSKQRGKGVIYATIKKIPLMHFDDLYTSYYSRGMRGRITTATKKWISGKS
jgi:ABC-type nitrate/sulfonate/bicarbonate transport system ATPase subunit